MTTAATAAPPVPSKRDAAAHDGAFDANAIAKNASEALASSTALYSEFAASEWKLLLTGLTVVDDDLGAAEGERAEESTSVAVVSDVDDGLPSASASSAATASSPPFPSLVSAVARGDYSLAFTTPEARRILLPQEIGEGGNEDDDEDEAARGYWSSVFASAAVAADGSPSSSACSSLEERLALGASALLAFVQAAFTGPELRLGSPRELAASSAAAAAAAPSPSALPLPLGAPLSPLDAAALEAAGANGESIDSRVRGPQFLALAVAVLLAPLGLDGRGETAAAEAGGPTATAAAEAEDAGGSGSVAEDFAPSSTSSTSSSLASKLSSLPPTWSLWAHRAACARQRVLAEQAAVTREALDLLPAFAAAAVQGAGSLLSSPLSPAEARLASAGFALESAACRLELREGGGGGGAVDGKSRIGATADAATRSPSGPFAAAALARAAAALGVSVSVQGAMGVRTIHQQEERAQLVCRVFRDGEQRTEQGGGESGDDDARAAGGDDARVAGGDDVSSLFGLGEEEGEEGKRVEKRQGEGEGDGVDDAPPSKLSGLAAERSEVLTAPRLVGVGAAAREEKKSRGDDRGRTSVEGDGGGCSPPPPSPPRLAPLTPPVQALLLLHAAAVRRGTADDGLRSWRAAPFVEALSARQQERREQEQQNSSPSPLSRVPLARSRWAVAACAALARARHELTRPRTRERALLAFERLAAAQAERDDDAKASKTATAPSSSPLPSSAAAARRRVPLALATPLPPSHRSLKEAADAMLSAGLVSEALDVYESVDAWEAAALCHRLLGHAEAARATLEARVADALRKKNNSSSSSSALLLPSLLCSLGDVTGDVSRYVEAWERSRGRCARAQRSIARAAASRGDWRAAARAWDLALSLNPIHGDGWFSRGYCALKLLGASGGDVGEEASEARAAALAFSRAAAEDPDNGEAWNNLAAVHLRSGRWQQAFSALSRAVALRRDSWQTWYNYASAALEVGEGAAAARGVAAVAELTDGRGLVGETGDGFGGGGGGLLLDLAKFVAEASDRYREKKHREKEGGEGEDRSESEGRGRPGSADGDLSQLTLDDDDERDSGDRGANAASPAASPLLSSRGLSSLRATAGRALRLAAATSACSARASTWKALAIFHDSDVSSDDVGDRDGSRAAAREARLKRVAVLSGGGGGGGGASWRSDARSFAEYASAAADLGAFEARAAAERREMRERRARGEADGDGGGDAEGNKSSLYVVGGGQRELASARMLLKAIVSTGRDRFDGSTELAEASGALEKVEAELRTLLPSR